MVHHGFRRVDNAKAGGAHLHAQVRVVEGHAVGFVKPFHLKEGFLFHHQAGRGHSRQLLRHEGPVVISGLTAGKALEAVIGQAAHADKDAGVLNGVVRIQEPRSHHSHIRFLTVPQHFREQIRRLELHVVVHKQQVVALGMGGAEVVDRGVVKAALPHDHPQPRVLFLCFLIIGKRFRIRAVVLNHDHFKRAIGTSFV